MIYERGLMSVKTDQIFKITEDKMDLSFFE